MAGAWISAGCWSGTGSQWWSATWRIWGSGSSAGWTGLPCTGGPPDKDPRIPRLAAAAPGRAGHATGPRCKSRRPGGSYAVKSRGDSCPVRLTEVSGPERPPSGRGLGAMSADRRLSAPGRLAVDDDLPTAAVGTADLPDEPLAEFAIAHGLQPTAPPPPIRTYLRQLWRRRRF